MLLKSAQILIPQERESQRLKSVCVMHGLVYCADMNHIAIDPGNTIAHQLFLADMCIYLACGNLSCYYMLLLNIPEG